MTRIIIPPYFQDPPGLPRAAEAPRLFDAARELQVKGGPMIAQEIPILPDRTLIGTLMQLGMPRWLADQVRTSPQARFSAVATWCLVQDAREGDPDAKTRLDYLRQHFSEMRADERATDHPDRAHSEIISPL